MKDEHECALLALARVGLLMLQGRQWRAARPCVCVDRARAHARACVCAYKHVRAHAPPLRAQAIVPSAHIKVGDFASRYCIGDQ